MSDYLCNSRVCCRVRVTRRVEFTRRVLVWNYFPTCVHLWVTRRAKFSPNGYGWALPIGYVPVAIFIRANTTCSPKINITVPGLSVIFRRDLRALQHAITKVQPYLTGPIRLANIRPEDAIRRPTYVLRPNIIFIPAFGFSAQLALAGGGIFYLRIWANTEAGERGNVASFPQPSDRACGGSRSG
jgi:hypothetical protein